MSSTSIEDGSTAQFNDDQIIDSQLLAPVAYSETALPALRLARSSRMARLVGRVLFFSLIIATLTIAAAPWQQSVKGTGEVIAYAPLERQQTLEAPIKGRIVRLGDGIFENAHVRKGDLIAEIADIDENYLARLEGQLEAAESQVDAADQVLTATKLNKEMAESVVESFTAQVRRYELARDEIVSAADAAIESARDKVEAKRQELSQELAALSQIQADYDRQDTLYREDIASQYKYQTAKRKQEEAVAKVAKARALVSSAENDLQEKISDREAKDQKARADIEYANAALRKAKGDIAKVESEIAKAIADRNKLQKEFLKTETDVARQRNQIIEAPFDGFITRITPNQSSQILKVGDPICVIVPDTADRAVQVWLDGNDAPLVEPGRHVRLQFEGWPAVQFAGWPSVAVGTFGGEVISVDAMSDGKGKFRLLVLPDEELERDPRHAWPNERFLRQGVRANGWVLLEKVPLWYEIWRNMNGFPPVVSTTEPQIDSKPPKLPKL